jgi:hypothetical protein
MFNFIGRVFNGVVNFVSNCISVINTICPGFNAMCYGMARNYAMARMGWI